MYQLINDRIAEITQAFKQVQDLEEYNWLSASLHKEDVSNSAHYQRRFRSYWGMRCSDEYGRAFFSKLEANKRESRLDPIEIAAELYPFPTRKQNKTLQFSFVTKLAHMIDSHLPIYDSMVRRRESKTGGLHESEKQPFSKNHNSQVAVSTLEPSNMTPRRPIRASNSASWVDFYSSGRKSTLLKFFRLLPLCYLF